MMYTLRTASVATAFLVLGALAPQVGSADSLQKILSTKKITVGTEAAMPPFEFIQDGKIVGYDKDILDYIVESENLSLEQTNLPWQGILPALSAGKFDLVATAVTVSAERAKRFAFTIPVAESTYFAVKRKGDARLRVPDDLSDKVVGAQLGSASEASGKAFDARLKSAGKKGLKELKLFVSFPEVYLGVANGELDAGIHSLPSLMALLKERPDTFELLGAVRDKTYYAWLTRGDDKPLRDFVSKKIKELRDSGKLYQLQEKWFGMRMEIPDESYLPEGAL